MKLIKAEWANASFASDVRHMTQLRELASLHCLCSECFQLVQDKDGLLTELTQNSALHWSRAFEWPWALINGDIESGNRCLDVGGGHAVFQYVAARCCKPGAYVNVDGNVQSHDAAHRMREKLGLENLGLTSGRLPKDWNCGAEDFDRVFCISVIEHDPNWRSVLEEMIRVLNPGGLLLLTMDVNRKADAKSEEFFLGEIEAKELMYKATGTPYDLPPRPPGTLGVKLNENELNCLALKFRK